MKRFHSYIIAAGMFLSVVVVSCNKEKDEVRVMTITTSATGEISISLAGTGTATIDWGDSSESDTKTILPPDGIDIAFFEFSHSYSDTQIRTITISGKKITGMICRHFPITRLDVSNNTKLITLECSFTQLPSLDISKNTALTDLVCFMNQLTSLDVSNNTKLIQLWCQANLLTSLEVSKNIALVWLDCSQNQLAADELDALFDTLHSNTITLPMPVPVTKEIHIYYNPGTDDCDQSIATKKGWTVFTKFEMPTSFNH